MATYEQGRATAGATAVAENDADYNLSENDDELQLAEINETPAAGTYDPYVDRLPEGPYNGSRYYAPVEGRSHVSGLFATSAAAQEAVASLEAMGVSRDEISVVARNASETEMFAAATGTTASSHASQGAGAGSVAGGIIGAILGALAATATAIVIPGVGVLLAGPIAGAIAGAGAGGITGGLIGALIGAGIPEETAQTYETGLKNGGVVVIADVPDHLQDQARMILGNASY